MDKKMKQLLIVIFCVLFIFPQKILAFINPNFTPLDLFQQSDQVLFLEFNNADEKGRAAAEVKEILKGNISDKKLTLDLLAGAFKAQGKELMSLINNGEKSALMFTGMFQGEGTGIDDGSREKAMGLLHIGGQWYFFNKGETEWKMQKTEARLLGTWSGSTDMLFRALKYIQANPDASIPVNVGVEWSGKIKIGKFKGDTNIIRPLDLAGNGKPDIFLTGENGDSVLRFNGKSFEDITAKLNLGSASEIYAWGDLNNDKKLDLVSWNKKGLTIYLQKADGSFEAKFVETGFALQCGCLSLNVIDYKEGEKVLPVILAGTRAAPVLLIPQTDGSYKIEPPAEKNISVKELGEGGKCLVADFDGDNIIDIIQVFERGGLFFKGKAAGSFNAPVETGVATGKGKYGLCLGDYDADGLLDIFIASEDWCRLWQNLGDGKFVDSLGLSGEINYISKGGGLDAQTADINNDGIQDIFIAYSSILAQTYFNRGFRSFGHGRELNIDSLLADSEKGQQTGCLADFNGDGAQDLAVVLSDGEAWLLLRKVNDKALSVTAALTASGSINSPVNVTAWKDKRCLGTLVISAGDAGAFFGVSEAGPITLKWTLPGGKAEEKEVIVKNAPVRIIINK